ncbi:hypothetical protein DPX39_110106800 [Trypanosoma brucei equiperdum]|uniref:Uncharacterized protein n=1 Tax=Trypanosoma brucei equiperdum TaxID=630700 RepID=A0A3L6KVP6_9TRYP|nr:hypothetical protein DPX39_110106800 [Trypanosoma brucei equiperdum]
MLPSLIRRVAPSRVALVPLFAALKTTTLQQAPGGITQGDNRHPSCSGEDTALGALQQSPQSKLSLQEPLRPLTATAADGNSVPIVSNIARERGYIVDANRSYFSTGANKCSDATAIDGGVPQPVEDPLVHMLRCEEELLHTSVERLNAERKLAEMKRRFGDEMSALHEGLKAREEKVSRMVRRAARESGVHTHSVQPAAVVSYATATDDWGEVGKGVAGDIVDDGDNVGHRCGDDGEIADNGTQTPRLPDDTFVKLQDPEEDDASTEDDDISSSEVYADVPSPRRGQKRATSSEGTVAKRRGRPPSLKAASNKETKKHAGSRARGASSRGERKDNAVRTASFARAASGSGKSPASRKVSQTKKAPQVGRASQTRKAVQAQRPLKQQQQRQSKVGANSRGRGSGVRGERGRRGTVGGDSKSITHPRGSTASGRQTAATRKRAGKK